MDPAGPLSAPLAWTRWRIRGRSQAKRDEWCCQSLLSESARKVITIAPSSKRPLTSHPPSLAVLSFTQCMACPAAAKQTHPAHWTPQCVPGITLMWYLHIVISHSHCYLTGVVYTRHETGVLGRWQNVCFHIPPPAAAALYVIFSPFLRFSFDRWGN